MVSTHIYFTYIISPLAEGTIHVAPCVPRKREAFSGGGDKEWQISPAIQWGPGPINDDGSRSNLIRNWLL